MSIRSVWKAAAYLLLLVAVVVLVSVLTAVAAGNTVASSRADVNSAAVTGNDLKPDACAGININAVIDLGAGDSATTGNDLILGTAGNDAVIRGDVGDDCILGGAGNESIFLFFGGIYGEDGDDVLIGGPGWDVCRGGGGNNTYIDCELEF